MDGSTSAEGTETSELPLGELEARITELAGQLNAANYRWLMLIAEFDRRAGWADGRLHSCAHWLNFKCGLALGAAREKLRVAHALPALPKIAACMRRGELSYSKVRALTRVATPATEDALLMIALHGTASHVEKIVHGFRRARQIEALSREAHQQATRFLDYWYDGDGSLVVRGRLPALAGALVVKALEAALANVPATEPDATDEDEYLSPQARRADALAVIAEGYRRSPRNSQSTADRFQVVVHVDAHSLEGGGDGRCHVEHGPSLPIDSVRRLACDASMVRIVEDEAGEPLDVGRKTRTIPPAIRRALQSRDDGCRFPGCTHRRFVDAHHVEHWINGGATKLANLVTLCRSHHRLMHEGGIRVEARPGGGWRFLRPDGREFDAAPSPPLRPYEWTELGAAHAAEGIHIDADTAACKWTGERMDYDLGVWVLCHQEERARHGVSAETFAALTPAISSCAETHRSAHQTPDS